MGVIFIRTSIIFIVLIVVMRFMGKRQIGEMQPYEFIVTLIIADLACIPMADISIPLVYGIVAVLTLFILHQLLSFIEQLGSLPKRIISGNPSVVINKLGVNVLELKRNNMGIDDLIESMRAQGYFSFDDLDYAIFESNGKLSAFENQERKENPTSIPIVIINCGKINKKNLPVINKSQEEITSFLNKNGYGLTSTEIMTLDGNGRVYIKKKKQKYEILFLELSGCVKW